MTRVLIVEDEAIASRKLEKLLSQNQIEVLASLKGNEEIKTYLSEHPEPDLYFMDIHLNDGIIFEFLKDADIKAPIIFTTAYDEYAIKAFKQNSIDYLLKPIDPQELKQALDKFHKLNAQNSQLDPKLLSQILMQSNNQSEDYKERIKIKIGDHFKSIKITDIALFYSKDKMNFALTTDARHYPIEYTLDNMFQELNPKNYFKVNRSYLISIDHINDIISYSNSRLKIIMNHAENHEIIVARERVQDFKSWLG